MLSGSVDRRTWSDTDRPGERVTVARPLAGVEIVSIRGSHRHWCEAHENFTLAVVHREQSRVVADWRTLGRSVSSECGDIMAIEPGNMHVTQRLKLQGGAADFCVVHFSPKLMASVARELGVLPDFHFRTPAFKDPPSFDALRRLVQATAAHDSLDVECASADALHTLISRLGETSVRAARSLDPVRDYRLRKVRDYLRAHLTRRPSLSELEVVADLSQWRLCVLFKRAFGIGIGQYWNALRLAEAARRLQRSTPIKMIVAALGYLDEPYFCRVFKAHYGVAPGRWLSLFRANSRLHERKDC
jgi:AraC-like DNA-binding protein